MALQMRESLATYSEAEDLINIGAYKEGSNQKIDRAIGLHDGVEGFLRQGEREASPPMETLLGMQQLVGR
jgi:flagellar biosynthesis/type III secretory pathway ATPase